MRKKTIILFFLLVPIVELLFYSCCGCDVETEKRNYSHKAIFLKNLDNSGEKVIESESLQLNKNAYGIRLYVAREKVFIARTKHINSIFIQSANATSCECPPEYIYFPSDSIVSIKIFTVNNFDNQHSENSDITNYFKVAHLYSNVENYVTKINHTYYSDFEDFSENGLSVDLLLMTAPTINNFHQFKIQVKLSDGRILEELTTEIELL